MTKRISDVLAVLLILWSFLYVFVNFLPEKWFLDYNEFTAENVCRDQRQQLTGTRWVPITVQANGVDQLWSVEQQRYVDRFEWTGRYHKGETTTGWKTQITSPAGEYQWHATTLKITLPLWVSIHISDVKTNTFAVVECE